MARVDPVEIRLDRVEAQLAIAQLVARYASAVDARDIDALVELYTDDAQCPAGRGRAAVRSYFESVLGRFYRSVHFVSGHVIEVTGAERATGTVHCRAEHEVGERWIVMALRYEDSYERRVGAWKFASRISYLWYATDVLERPAAPGYVSWDAHPPAQLPARFHTWQEYWRSIPAEQLESVTRAPTP